ncbi:MAG TPA: hypothetical protein VFV32_08275 [Acidimicrobiales bacterium]|jgi:hypothetical protein|nr:hypothetical protein [Acidimicrobiales bacterium]
MELLWAVPPVAVAVATVLLLVQLRAMGDAAAELGLQLRRLDEVRVAVSTVRAEAAAARGTAQGLRHR